MRPRSRPVLYAFGLLPACQQSQVDPPPFTTAPPMTSAESTGASAGTTADSSTGSSTGSGAGTGSTAELSTGSVSGETSSSGTTLVLDVGTDVDLGDPKPPGCDGKIDFLFVISRWAGMSYFQEQLLAAFPQFIDTIEARFSDFDFHIMVVDGDPYWGLVTCDEKCPEPCVPGYPCGYTPTACDETMGAGSVYPAGYEAANTLCPIDGGRRYMTKEQTNLKETFACAAQLGRSGADWMGEALTAALQPALSGPGGCNDGFLRDDALLMVTLISNTFDYGPKPSGSEGTPGTWAATVLEAKHNEPGSVVMFSILDSGDPECDPKDRTCQMVKTFPHHLLIDRDEPDYGPFFEQATELVEVACADFIPPG